jgi:hypothetical protein
MGEMTHQDLPVIWLEAFARDIDMALDPRKLRATELVRLLNTSPLGEVLDERRLRDQRSRAGFRIGDEKTVDLFRYAAWLWSERRVAGTKGGPAAAYEAKKEQARRRSLEQVASGQDIGEIPPVKDQARRDACERNFRLFCETYLPLTFAMAWSRDHLKAIAKIEKAVLEGGLFALAMPRGSGKTSLAIAAAVWALIYGHRGFVVLIGATEAKAGELLDSIRVELEHNDLLLEDFPETCHPIRELEGINQRRLRYRGQVVEMAFTTKRIQLPLIPGTKSTGGIVRAVGITGSLRGMNHKRSDGQTIRPDFVIPDDPQTRKSAKSPTQNADRLRILAGDVLGLAGPGQKICGVMPCTVICPGDAVDEILDRKKHPDWQGERTKMLYAFPSNELLWEEYARIRAQGLEEDRGAGDATAFYAAHRAEMDAGADVAWPDRHDPDELSGLQHAMNKKLLDEQAFWAEYQNEPLAEKTDGDVTLTADQIVLKANALARGKVPLEANYVAAFIDVQLNALFWAVAAWSQAFAGQVLDYGCYPDQKRQHFAYSDVRHTLGRAHPKRGLEGAIHAGLAALTSDILARDWLREDGAPLRIGLCLIDANWQTDTVIKFCRDATHAAVIRPARGKYVGASSKGLNDREKKPGDLRGLNWRIPAVRGKREVRQVEFDTNYWKSFLQARLATAAGDRGALSLFAARPDQHRMLADHVTAEYPVTVGAKSTAREIQEWKARLGRDNHWLDCLVGCCVGGSVLGAELIAGGPPAKRKSRKNWGQMRRERMARNG